MKCNIPVWCVQCASRKYNDNDDDDTNNVGRDSSVGIATRYGLDGPGIKSRGGGQWVPALYRG